MSQGSLDMEQVEATPSAPVAIDLLDCQESIQRMSQSRHFRKAPLLTSFLLHVCERSLAVPGDRITEYEIGVQVFRRSKGFDPRQDNIVRSYARQLRKRLEEYYSTDGSSETLRILLPKGGYTPVFEKHWPQQVTPQLEALEDTLFSDTEMPISASRYRRNNSVWLLWSGPLALFCSLLIFATTWRMLHIRQQQTANTVGPLHPLWSQIFSDRRDTFVVPSDVGFVIMQQANRRTFTLAEYLGWQAANHAPDNLAMSYLKDQSYTSILNLNFVSQLQRLPEAFSERFLIRAARALRLEDLQESNAVLIGSNLSNPWAELFGSQLNFHFVNHPESDSYWVINGAPVPGERSVYGDPTKNYRHQTYGVIAFLPNLSNNGRVLLIQGLDAAGTQAAVNLLFENTESMNVLLAQAAGPGGAIKSFEVLVEATSFGFDSRAVNCHILAKRIYH